jgi:hypothetical protein
MKWAVYILLMAALIYAGETIRMPFQLAEEQKTTMCCHQGKEQECPYNHPGKPSQNNKNGCCIDCRPGRSCNRQVQTCKTDL